MTNREETLTRIDGLVLTIYKNHVEQIIGYRSYLIETDKVITLLEEDTTTPDTSISPTVYLLLKQELKFIREQRKGMNICFEATEKLLKLTKEYLKIRGIDEDLL